ncbi:MAG TPA: YkgJ family cysteine cluster protein [Tepidisphaeraceae bacterium]|nr:YkgJ family cysteine cluster protein [Tepidisphaeraceae bacterium]
MPLCDSFSADERQQLRYDGSLVADCCMIQSNSIYDCQTCGACCASPWRDRRTGTQSDPETQVQIVPSPYFDDYPVEPAMRSPDEVETYVTAEGLRVCTALAGCIGVRCECTIYERRPKACQSVEIGGALCREARQHFGLPV